MPTRSKTARTAAMIAWAIFGAMLAAASTALAKDDGPPNIDIRRTCQQTSGVLTGMTGNEGQNVSTCMNDEQIARDELVKTWVSYPALARSECIKPNEYLPGYVERQACLDMTRDVLKMRQGQAASAPAGADAYGQAFGGRTGSKRSSKSRECPVVQAAPDGSIDWVVNC